jgi:hypothetical protein
MGRAPNFGDPAGLYYLSVGKGLTVFGASGLGGGSLINAGVVLRPSLSWLRDAGWPHEVVSDGLLLEGLARAEKMLGVGAVPDPERFGVAEFDPADPRRVIGIEEKPHNPKSNYAVTGLYLYDNRVFDYIRQCDPEYAGRGELEITQVNNFYLREGTLRWEPLEGFWSDAGTFESLYNATRYWAEKALRAETAQPD